MNNIQITPDLLEQIVKDKKVRKSITTQSHHWFMPVYLGKYLKFESASFQKEMIDITEDTNSGLAVILAFRGSAKSTIMTLSYPIWAALGMQQKKFILIISKTQGQAKLHFSSIKRELETNDRLKQDLGPFTEEIDEWGSYTIVLTRYNARITAVSSEQSIRGMRHDENRPDLIICDDVEDLQSVKTRDGRNKTYNWFVSEVMPVGDSKTKIILIGNLLHEDSLIMRIKEDIKSDRLNGIVKTYPFMNEKNEALWKSKFPTPEDIENEKKRIGDRVAWEREFMLNIVPDADQVIDPKWIQYYDKMPHKDKLQSIRIGVDLAISERDTADKTAMVTGWVFTDCEKDIYQVYIDSIVINKRMSFPETVETCKMLHNTLKNQCRADFVVEDVAYQRALPQLLEQYDLSVSARKIGSQDKRSRLNIVSHRIKSGEILFPREGCKELIDQLINFGIERYDDLVDAFTILILDIIENPPSFPHITVLTFGNNDNYDDDAELDRLMGIKNAHWRRLF